MKHVIAAFAVLTLAGAAHARTTTVRLNDGAHNLTLVSAKAGKVVVGSKTIPSQNPEEVYPDETVYIWGPGLKVVVAYTANRDSFVDYSNAGDDYPTYTDHGTDEISIPGATQLLSYNLADVQSQETVEDYKHSVYCSRNNETGEKDDDRCQDQIATKVVTVTHQVLTLITD